MDMASAPDRNHADLMLLLTEWHTLERFDLPTTPMPTFMLTQEQREDLVSYILTFRPAVDSKQARAAD
jgi:mono/diheme cytochrome c family protein